MISVAELPTYIHRHLKDNIIATSHDQKTKPVMRKY